LQASLNSTVRQLGSELRLLHHSRRISVVLFVAAATVVVAFTGSVSAAASAHRFFLDRVAYFGEQGVTLADALRAPLHVTQSGHMEENDNPLKYDYLQVSTHVQALRGVAMVGTALDLVTFVAFPLLFLVLGSHLATYDRTSGTLKLRASRERWSRIAAAKVLALGVVSAAATAFVGAFALLVAYAGSPWVDRMTQGIDYQLATPPSVSPLAVKLLTTAGVGLLFGVIGYAVGVVTRSASWPMVLASAVLFVVPFFAPWDPRNALAVLGRHVYDFWGQFEMRPPLPLSTGAAWAVVLGCLASSASVVGLSARYPRLR
jgi:hypothetical protein